MAPSCSKNPEGHQNRLVGSKVTAILMKGWILSIGGVALGRVCVCSMLSRLVWFCQNLFFEFGCLLMFKVLSIIVN